MRPAALAAAVLILAACGAVTRGAGGTASAPRTTSPSLPSPSITCASQARPPTIGGMSVTWIKSRNQIVLFGGDDGTHGPTAGTWVYGSGCWNQKISAASPSARDSMTSAYDAAHDVVVLYGGRTGGPGQPGRFLYDTWTWNGQTWTQALSAGPIMVAPTAAYDPIAKRVIMFGSTAAGVAQTWAWGGQSWQLLVPPASPSGRIAASMTFDVATNQLLLFGGDQTLHPVSETWTWDGSTWHQRTPASSPQARFSAAIASYEPGSSVVLFGGADRNQVYGDTWRWDGSTWSPLHPSHAPPSMFGGTAFDTGSQVELIAGNGELWTWDGTDWSGPWVGSLAKA
jgi:hypothetical protein